MATTTSLAQVLLAAAAPNPPVSAPKPSEKNILLYARDDVATAVPVVTGTLAYLQGGLADEAQLRPRVCALLGAGATLNGVAAVVKPIVDKAPTGPALTADDLAKALYVYNAKYLGAPSTASPLPAWRAGLRLTLPIEMDLAHHQLVVNRVSLQTWAGAFNPADQNRLVEPAPGLPLPGAAAPGAFPDTLDTARTTAVTQLTGWPPANLPGVLPTTYGNRVLTNAFEVVFELVEVLRRLRLTNPGGELAFVLAMADLVVAEQAYGIGWTSAGHAVLRRMWDTLSAGRATPSPADAARFGRARTIVATGLRLHPKAGDWFAPQDFGPDVDPVELPLDGKGNPIREDKSGVYVSVLGREIPVGPPKSIAGGWRGPGTGAGKWPIDGTSGVARQVHDTAFPAGTSARRLACLDVVTRIARNEGALDAVQAGDAGLVSCGIQQWTLMGDNEMTVLLHRLQKNNPEHYDLLFGLYGLQPQTPVPADNPYENGSVSGYGDDFATIVHLDTVPRAAARTALPTGATRTTYFGGKLDSTVKRRWCARFRLAALFSLDWNATQMQTAVFRFQRLIDQFTGLTTLFTVPSGGQNTSWKLTELFTSQFAVAAVFDAHINAPSHIAGDVRRAIDLAVANGHTAPVGGTPPALAEQFLVRLSVDYLALRFLFAGGKVSRDGVIVGQFDGGLSGVPGTFQGW